MQGKPAWPWGGARGTKSMLTESGVGAWLPVELTGSTRTHGRGRVEAEGPGSLPVVGRGAPAPREGSSLVRGRPGGPPSPPVVHPSSLPGTPAAGHIGVRCDPQQQPWTCLGSKTLGLSSDTGHSIR